MREKILTYIEKNSRVSLRDLAILLGTDEVTVANEIAEMEKEHIICGYHTLIDWDKTTEEKVTALIEVKVTPQRGWRPVPPPPGDPEACPRHGHIPSAHPLLPGPGGQGRCRKRQQSARCPAWAFFYGGKRPCGRSR